MIRSSVYGDVYSKNGYTLLSLNCQVRSSESTIPMNALSQQRSRFMCHFTYPQSVLFFIPFTPALEAGPIGVLRSPRSPCQSNKCPTPVEDAETFGPTQSSESIHSNLDITQPQNPAEFHMLYRMYVIPVERIFYVVRNQLVGGAH